MLRPVKPSSAGTNVTDATIITSTVAAAPAPRPRMKSTPIRKSPQSEITTVAPAKSTARPAVSMASSTAALRTQTVVQPLAVPGDDEQRVVDPDAEPDHRRELRRELRHDHDVREQAHDREPGGDRRRWP